MSDSAQLKEVSAGYVLGLLRQNKANSFVELVPFLRDKNPQVRQIALANLLGQTPKGSPHRDIFYSGLRSGGLQQPQEPELIRDIKILCRDQLVCMRE